MPPCLNALPSMLLLVAAALPARADDPEARYLDLCKQFNDAQNSFVGTLYKAKNRAMARDADALSPNVREYCERFLEVARAKPGSDTELKAIFWILTYSPGGREAEEGLKLLARNHLDDVKLSGPLLPLVEWPTEGLENLLRAAIEKSTVADVRAHATLTLAKIDMAKARREAAAGSGTASFDEAEKLLKSLAADYGDVKIPGPDGYGDFARAGLAKLGPRPREGAAAARVEEGTEIGRKAPDIDAPDTTGKRTRLSQYAGSVRIIFFWGHWCPYCHDMYPFGRTLRYRFSDKPVVVLGVNSDGDLEQLRRLIVDEGITFPTWADGSHGPIANLYKVNRFPTTIVLDHKGIVRFKSQGIIDEQSLTRAVDTLVAERALDPKADEAPAAGDPPKAAGKNAKALKKKSKK